MSESTEGRKGNEGEERLTTFDTPYQLGEEVRRSLRTYTLKEVPAVVEMNQVQTGAWQHTIALHRQRSNLKLVSEMFAHKYTDIPYAPLLVEGSAVYGDYTTPHGQDEFQNSDLIVTPQAFTPPEWAKTLWRFSELKQARTFTRDDVMATVRGLSIAGDVPRFTVGAGRYSDAFYSMGSEGVIISLTDKDWAGLAQKDISPEHRAELEELYGTLVKKYGTVSLREAVLQETGGVLPQYGDQVYSANLGVAGTALTTEGEYVFVKRGASVAVNQGINVTASGGADFDKEALSRYGIGQFLAGEMAREAAEEINLNSGTLLLGAMQEKIRLELGIEDPSEYDLVPVGFARELPRGGSPESMFLVRYKGSTDDLVRKIMHNKNEGRAEIDTHVYAMPRADAREILVHPEGTKVIQHKAVLNLIFIEEWLKRNG